MKRILRVLNRRLWRVIRRHDLFFKWVLGQPGVLEALLRYILPGAVLDVWNGARPEPLPQSSVSAKLEETHNDRAYRCPTVAESGVDLLVVIEHKSKPDGGVLWQLSRYLHDVTRNWMSYRKKQGMKGSHKVPVVILIVVYHGQEEWNVPLSYAEMTGCGEALMAHVPDFRYILLDVCRILPDHLPVHPRLRTAFLIWQFDRRLSREGTTADGKACLTDLARTALSFGIEDLTALVYYLLNEFGPDDSALLKEVLGEIVPKEQEGIMQTVGEQLRAEGRTEGRIEGRTEGRVEGRVEGEARMLLRLLQRRFGALRADVVKRVEAANLELLDRWSERLFDATSLDEVFVLDQRR
jgi:hypothetical protein